MVGEFSRIAFEDFLPSRGHIVGNISASATETLFTFTVPQSTVAFITGVASNWYLSTKINFFVDGEAVFRDYQKILGNMASPREFIPPIQARKEIKVVVQNDNTEVALMEVLLIGFFVPLGEIAGKF